MRSPFFPLLVGLPPVSRRSRRQGGIFPQSLKNLIPLDVYALWRSLLAMSFISSFLFLWTEKGDLLFSLLSSAHPAATKAAAFFLLAGLHPGCLGRCRIWSVPPAPSLFFCKECFPLVFFWRLLLSCQVVLRLGSHACGNDILYHVPAATLLVFWFMLAQCLRVLCPSLLPTFPGSSSASVCFSSSSRLTLTRCQTLLPTLLPLFFYLFGRAALPLLSLCCIFIVKQIGGYSRSIGQLFF